MKAQPRAQNLARAAASWTEVQKAYLAGFLDGDGSIILQIVNQPRRRYGFALRVSVVYFQKKSRRWHMLWLQRHCGGEGSLRQRGDGIVEYALRSKASVKTLSQHLLPHLRMKKRLARLALQILHKEATVKSKADFLQVCQLIDKAALHTEGKKRKITSKEVAEKLKITCRDFDH